VVCADEDGACKQPTPKRTAGGRGHCNHVFSASIFGSKGTGRTGPFKGNE
jgi:hypothetical protein